MNRLLLSLVFLGGQLFSSNAQAQCPKNKYQLSNFSQSIVISKHAGGGNTYQAEGVEFKLGRSIIVKLASSVKLNQIAALVRSYAFLSFDYLYQGADFQYIQITLPKESCTLSFAQELAKHPAVLLAQPDLQQRRSFDHGGHNHKVTENSGKRFYFLQLDIANRWSRTRGKGVKVAVIDQWVDLSHPEFSHLKAPGYFDLNPEIPVSDSEKHGTQVASIIFSRHEGSKVKGIAPEADLIAIRQLDTGTGNTIKSFLLAAREGADIINASWNSSFLLEPLADLINELSSHGRAGKGIAIVFSAGNEGDKITDYYSEAALTSAVVVGNSRRSGRPTGHSNYGPSVDAYVFSRFVTAAAPDRQYQQFSGTSLAAAVVSGYFAQLLSLEPDLTVSMLVQRLQEAVEHGRRH